MLLDGRVAIVTGIGPGLGQEVVAAFTREGAKVVMGARTQSYLDEIVARERSAGADVVAQPLDITRPEMNEAIVERALAEFGRIDVLVNNAYTPFPLGRFETADLADWKAISDTNVFGALHLTQLVVPHMKAVGGGSVVFINSMIVRKPFPEQGGYATSKGGLASAARILATELGGYGIRVNTLYIGWMWGPPTQGFLDGVVAERGISLEEAVGEVTANIPLGVIPDDGDCANAVVFLASDLSKAITGAGIDVNGGEVMS